MAIPNLDYKVLGKLRANYLKAKGRPFEFFFCPILWVDEDAPLCMGHVEATLVELTGTITDKTMLLCQVGRERPWAIIVFIRVMQSLHAIMVPAMEDAEGAARFQKFLTNDTEKIAAKWARFQDDHWEVELTPMFSRGRRLVRYIHNPPTTCFSCPLCTPTKVYVLIYSGPRAKLGAEPKAPVRKSRLPNAGGRFFVT